MANFEGLIRQALAAQDSSDPAIRQKIYQSSRNALARMLEKSGKTDDATVRAQFARLEQSIESVEAGYAAPSAPEPIPAPVPEPQPEPEPEPQVIEEVATESSAETQVEQVDEPLQQPAPEPAPQAEPQEARETFSTQPEPERREPSLDTPEEPARASSAQEPARPQRAGLPEGYQPAPLFPPLEDTPPTQSRPEPDFEASLQAHLEPEKAPQIEQQPAFTAPPAAVPAQTPEMETPAARQEPHQPDPPAEQPVEQPAEEPAYFEPSRAEPQQQPSSDWQEPVNDWQQQDAGQPVEPYLGDVYEGRGQAADETYPEYADNGSGQFGAERDVSPTYRRKHPLLRRIWPIIVAIAVLMVILWILYALFSTRLADGGATAPAASVGETSQGEDGSTFITLLQPTDLSALVTAGRGSAELVTEQSQQMLRLKSIRQSGSASANADPILLELERGVLRQINGKDVTVEFYTKSGGSGPAQFSIQCDIGGDSVCGRKRFRVGLQPERILFKLDLTGGISTEDRAFLAINTDVTNAADATGSGDEIDIVHVRLRLNEDGS